MTDGHYPTYAEFTEKVDWTKYGVDEKGCGRDPRCDNCMMHSGFEPSGAFSRSPRDTWNNIKYNFGPRPKPYVGGPELTRTVFNGASIGKGHLAEAKAAINSGLVGAKSAFARGGNDLAPAESGGGGCSSGDTSQRDELLAKIRGKAE
jgi:hypothetical protein